MSHDKADITTHHAPITQDVVHAQCHRSGIAKEWKNDLLCVTTELRFLIFSPILVFFYFFTRRYMQHAIRPTESVNHSLLALAAPNKGEGGMGEERDNDDRKRRKVVCE